MKEELLQWRIDELVREMESYKERGRILAFVRGLRLSARLIYVLRTALSDRGVEVSWGHLLDENERLCSPECDVIIHKSGSVQRWNGHEEPVMDFRFVSCTRAVAVVSCKSLLDSVDRDLKAYCAQMQRYVKRVLLFAECCRPRKVERLSRAAKEAGYGGLWYLYVLEEGSSEPTVDERVWMDFLQTLRRLTADVKESTHASKPR
jgi:hypothetical protein